MTLLVGGQRHVTVSFIRNPARDRTFPYRLVSSVHIGKADGPLPGTENLQLSGWNGSLEPVNIGYEISKGAAEHVRLFHWDKVTRTFHYLHG